MRGRLLGEGYQLVESLGESGKGQAWEARDEKLVRPAACSRYVRRMQQPPQQVPALLDGPAVDVSDARELLLGYLEWYRQALMRKLAGLSDDQLRTPVEPLGWTPLGLVQHVGWVERRWMRWGFAAEDVVAYPPGGDAAEWTISGDTSTAEVMAAYQAEVTAANSRTAAAALNAKALPGGRFKTPGQAPSLGRILFHLLQEYARHVGHLDVARRICADTVGDLLRKLEHLRGGVSWRQSDSWLRRTPRRSAATG